MPRFSELFARARVEPDRLFGDVEVEIEGICEDTRILSPGQAFVCMPSASGDTHRFLSEAKARGAVAAIVHSESGLQTAIALNLPAALIRHENLRFGEALWRLAKTAFGNPSARMRIVGVTGTNGKTTTAWLMRDALNALGRRAAYIGTLGIQTPDASKELGNTTPFAVELQRLLSECVASGSTDLAMEVSSHALSERRADGVEFDAAVFTNLTQDHLDYHASMEEYALAKSRLFKELPEQSAKRFVSAINADDSVGRSWLPKLKVPTVTFGLVRGELRGKPLEVRVDGLRMEIVWKGESAQLCARLGGMFNVWNCLSACAGLLALGHSLEEAVRGLGVARPVPGRFEAVPNDRGIGILVDYAHTPDALEKLLNSVRELQPKRVIAVFGCGGDRDRTKRPKMAAVASRLADLVIVTSDNPRTEDPQAILDDVIAGLGPGSDWVRISDRREAVSYAIEQARPGDVVVIAGKGHENYQIVGRTKHPMDDRQLAREALSSLGAGR